MTFSYAISMASGDAWALTGSNAARFERFDALRGSFRVVTRQYAFDDIVSLDGIVASEGGDECVSHPRPRSRSPCLRMTNA